MLVYLLCVFISQMLWAVQGRTDFLYQAEVVADRVNIRSQPSVRFLSFGTLKKEEKVYVLKEEAEWVQVILPSRFPLWVSERVVERHEGQERLRISKKKVNLRMHPSIGSDVICQLFEGQMLTIVKKKMDWWAVKSPQPLKAWVFKQFIKKTANPIDLIKKEWKERKIEKDKRWHQTEYQTFLSLDKTSVLSLMIYYLGASMKEKRVEDKQLWSRKIKNLYRIFVWEEFSRLSVQDVLSRPLNPADKKIYLKKIQSFLEEYHFSEESLCLKALLGYLEKVPVSNSNTKGKEEKESFLEEEAHKDHIYVKNIEVMQTKNAPQVEIAFPFFNKNKDNEKPKISLEELKNLSSTVGSVYHTRIGSKDRFRLVRSGRTVFYLRPDRSDLDMGAYVFKKVKIWGHQDSSEPVFFVKEITEIS